MTENRRGMLLGVAAYALWGLFPLYWPLLEPAGAVEILAHRIFWSLVLMGALVVGSRRTRQLRAVVADPRTRGILALAAALVTLNWGTYIWGVNHHHVVETSLGYFINPLVTVLMGVVILGERLRRLQWIALGVGGVAVLVLAVEYGRPPWIALLLAFSFGSYGLCKKKANVGAVESLTFETSVIAPIAFGYIVWLTATGSSHFASSGLGHALLLVGTGLVTAVPLICFGGAATRLSLTSLGILQYIAPVIQFAIGVFILREPMPPMRWVGFVLVWVALVLFTVESVGHRRRTLRSARGSVTAAEAVPISD
ncbi:MAG: EamA family transporter RarD [Nocardioidaceae bacterium]